MGDGRKRGNKGRAFQEEGAGQVWPQAGRNMMKRTKRPVWPEWSLCVCPIFGGCLLQNTQNEDRSVRKKDPVDSCRHVKDFVLKLMNYVKPPNGFKLEAKHTSDTISPENLSHFPPTCYLKIIQYSSCIRNT